MRGHPVVQLLLSLHLAALLLFRSANDRFAADLPGSVAAPIEDLETLMQLFAHSEGVRAEFTETRLIEILQDPIETRGELYFSPPDRLARHTHRPGRSSVVVHGNRLTLRDETGKQSLDLDSNVLARSLVDNFSVLLSGDLETLHKRYEVEFSRPQGTSTPNGKNWSLELRPRSSLTRTLIEKIHIDGREALLTRMETVETNGDRSVMVFTSVQTGLEFSADDLVRFFSVEEAENAP